MNEFLNVCMFGAGGAGCAGGDGDVGQFGKLLLMDVSNETVSLVIPVSICEGCLERNGDVGHSGDNL